MDLKSVELDLNKYPQEFHKYLVGAKIFDSSCSTEASVIFIDKGDGYFLKTAKKGELKNESIMTEYFHGKGLSAKVENYVSKDKDWLLTEKISGQDCLADIYLENPKKLCDTIAENLIKLHALDCSDCPIQNRTGTYISTALNNYQSNGYDKRQFPDSFGYSSAKQAFAVFESNKKYLKSDTLIHGDYCLPNVILNNWEFGGFIDVGYGGVSDKHIDLFWGVWTLFFNFKTDKYQDRFFDAYGRNNFDEEMLRVIAAAEVFG